jgi:hypothetical protein
MIRLNFFFPEDLAVKLKAYTKSTGVPMSEVVRQALTAFFAKRDG